MDIQEFDFLSEEDKKCFQTFFSDTHRQFLERIKMSEEEFHAFCKPYLEECESLTSLVKEQQHRKNELHQVFIHSIAREEFSIGGETIPRGFYCPSLVQDIVIGNCKRGKLCKADNPKACYTHYFDSNNRHIATKHGENIEYISFHENKTLGVLFSGNHLETVSICDYDTHGRIQTYIHLLCSPDGDSVYECEKEAYTYDEDRLVVEHSVLMVHNPPLLSFNKYVFFVKDQYLQSYFIEIFDCEDIRNRPLKERTYRVQIKRKI